MATSTEKDDQDDKDEAADAKDEAAEKAEEEAEEKPASKPASSSTKPSAKSAARSSRAGSARSASTASTSRARPPQTKQGSSLGKSMILFVVIIGGLAAGFAFLGREENRGPAKPKWTVGQTVDVEITLVKNDKNDLSCASAEEVGGKHCAFESISKPSTKDSTDDKKLLKPYTTTDRMQFAAAGVWSEPALAGDKLPASRFSLKCKLKVEGTLKNLSVRWDPTGQWHANTDWFAGSVSDCKLAP